MGKNYILHGPSLNTSKNWTNFQFVICKNVTAYPEILLHLQMLYSLHFRAVAERAMRVIEFVNCEPHCDPLQFVNV